MQYPWEGSGLGGCQPHLCLGPQAQAPRPGETHLSQEDRAHRQEGLECQGKLGGEEARHSHPWWMLFREQEQRTGP